jgi:hypothetical protein
MKCIMVVFILGVSCAFNLICGQVATTETHDSTKLFIPKVKLVYQQGGTVFDRNCATFLNKPIKQEWVEETANRLNEFQSLWDEDGPQFLKTAFEAIGQPFPYREMQATLTVCTISSMSSPLLLNVRDFLKTSEKQLPLWYLSEIVFHELMHTYTRRVYNTSLLRKKYATEQAVVLNHLHVMALEKLVLQTLGRNENLQWLDLVAYTTENPPSYQRAWEIVNKIEGYEVFIKELKQLSK